MSRRYDRAPVLGLNQRYGTSFAIPTIRENIRNGNIRFQVLVLQESTRLDILAGKFYGSGALFWVISAASDIGNTSQASPGTLIKIPNLQDVFKYVGS